MQEGFSKPPWPPFPRQVVDWFLPPTTLRRVLAHDPHPTTCALRTRPRGPPCRELCALSTACPFYRKFSSCFKKACKFRAFLFRFSFIAAKVVNNATDLLAFHRYEFECAAEHRHCLYSRCGPLRSREQVVRVCRRCRCLCAPQPLQNRNAPRCLRWANAIE